MSAGSDWVDGYVKAWTTNDPDDIAALFTPEAVYAGEPDDPAPWRGLDEIVTGWIGEGDEPGEWSFEWAILAETPELLIVEGRTRYAEGPDYANLWVVRLEGGLASSFTEWYLSRAPG